MEKINDLAARRPVGVAGLVLIATSLAAVILTEPHRDRCIGANWDGPRPKKYFSEDSAQTIDRYVYYGAVTGSFMILFDVFISMG